MEIKVLGTGCQKCIRLEKQVVEALEFLGIKEEVIKVKEIKDIMSYGVMSTPALVVNGKVVIQGQVPSVDQLKEILK